MLNIGFFAFLVLLLILFKKLQNRQFSMKISRFDGPTRLPILGNSLLLRGSPTDSFHKIHKWIKEYPDRCYVFWMFNEPYVVTGRREDVQALTKMHYKCPTNEFFKYSMGTGLLVLNGEKWKKRKAIVESVFATSELSTNILHIFNQESYTLIDEIKEVGMGVECNIWPIILRASTRTISETTIGSAKRDDLNISQGYGTGTKRCEKLIMKRMYSPWLHPEFIFKLYLNLSRQSRVFESVRTPFLEAIKKRKHLLALEKKAASDGTSQSSRKLILDILMDLEDFSDEELVDEILTLMFSGSDTTATVICFTLLMLAMHPEIQEKVYQELKIVFHEKDKPADVADLLKLTLLERCIKETLRKFSIVPVIVRQAVTEVTLSDGRVVPAGSNVMLSIHAIHHNPDYYPNPDVWNPHNFDPDQVAQRPIHTFIPFAAGVRACVGFKYAMMSLKVFLSHILRNFKLTTQQTEVKLGVNVLTKCRNGYLVKFEPR